MTGFVDVIIKRSNKLDLFHDSEKLVLADFHVALSVSSLDHVCDGIVVKIEKTLVDHSFDFAKVQSSRPVIVEVLKYLFYLLLQILSIQLNS
jgi:hypothetical protein